MADAPAGLRRLWMLRTMHPRPGEALRFHAPAFWATFAREPIDVVFLDGVGRVAAIRESLPRWRGTGVVERAACGILLPAGTCDRVPIRIGDILEFTPHTSERVAAGAKPEPWHS